MRGVNRIILIGNLGKDPELRHTPSGTTVCSVTLACNESYNKTSGEKIEHVEWVNLTLFGKLAEVLNEYAKKGSQIYAAGKLQTQKYDKDGQERSITKVVVNELLLLGGKGDASSGTGSGQDQYPEANRNPYREASSPYNAREVKVQEDFEDDLPF